MARVLPSSLSPHVCTITSPDLSELLDSSSLPSLAEILQSFSPLPQVTTRTTALTSVPHATFALRFSDLYEMEEACREDEERRAARLFDWMSGRISKRCVKWVSEVEGPEGRKRERENWRTPWWDEVRRCAEGDFVPSRYEGWNHPVAIILAVSTTAPNPLQAVAALHARPLQLPTWVDSNYLKYTLIIHPQSSPLSNEETTALFNAVKKQYGIDVYLLPLTLPSHSLSPVPVPPPIPRLPRPIVPESSPMPRNPKSTSANGPTNSSESASLNSLQLVPSDIQQTSKFVREFVVGCLIPWMEKNVLEWSEAFSSNRRLPSRLFSSTRRLFGSPSPSPSPSHNASSSVVSLPRSSISSLNGLTTHSPPSQQRRLAEFATILGDYKLAVTIWESLRKDSKGGSDVLPLVVSTSPALSLHASNSIASIFSGNQEAPPQGQFRALLLAVRWEAGIPPPEFADSVLEGERWLVWAAGNSEEAPGALLIAHAAHLSSKKQSIRRAAYWYAVAASRLEKCGIKPLTMHFLRKAQELYKNRPPKEISPSFWDAVGKSPSGESPWFDAIMSGIEHPLGRLLYTTGDVSTAVQLFLALLRGSEALGVPTASNVQEGEIKQLIRGDKILLDDFRVAFGHLKDTQPAKAVAAELKLPLKFCQMGMSKLRFPGDGSYDDPSVWKEREENWKSFWRAQGGKDAFAKSGDIIVGETFWVDLVVRNPLDAEVNLANWTLVVQETNVSQAYDESDSLVDVDVIEDVTLAPRESRTILFAVTPQRSGTFQISLAKYSFLSLLPTTEILSTRGRRLNATPAQRQRPTYAPDKFMTFSVAEATHKLAVSFVEGGRMTMFQGERRVMNLWVVNIGPRPVKEIWMVPGAEDGIWIGDVIESDGEEGEEGRSEEKEVASDTRDKDNVFVEVVKSSNSLASPKPLRIPIPGGVLGPEDGFSVPLILHTEVTGEKHFCLCFVYREEDADAFHRTRLSRVVNVQPLFHVTSTVEPDQSSSCQFSVNISLENVSNVAVRLTQVSTISPLWLSSPVMEKYLPVLSGYQSCKILLKTQRWPGAEGWKETTAFAHNQISSVLNGRPVGKEDPPPIDLCCSSITQSSQPRKSSKEDTISTFIHGGRRNYVSRQLASTHVHIPASTHPHIFPLYNPSSFDILVFWEIVSLSFSPLSALPSTFTSADPSPSVSKTPSLSSSQYFLHHNSRKSRSGLVSIHGLTLGAWHAPLQSSIEGVENAKGKRSIYAETMRENLEMLEAIRICEWNMEMNPLDVVVKSAERIQHDFLKGSCRASVDLTIRNYSVTHEVGYTFRLRGSSDANNLFPSVNLHVLPAPYSSKLNFRGIIPPSGSVTLHPMLWITRPGIYSLDGWRLDAEIYELPDGESCLPSTSPSAQRKVRHRYTQESPVSDHTCLIVQDASQSGNGDNNSLV